MIPEQEQEGDQMFKMHDIVEYIELMMSLKRIECTSDLKKKTTVGD